VFSWSKIKFGDFEMGDGASLERGFPNPQQVVRAWRLDGRIEA
jgi:hypothetical protein